MATSNPFGDPQTMALMGLAQGLLSAGSPSPMPVSVGGALAQGFGGALNNAMATTKMNQQQALIDLERLKTDQLGNQIDFQRSLFGMPPLYRGVPSQPAPQPQSPQPQSSPATVAGGGMMTTAAQGAPAAAAGPLPIPSNSPLAQLPPDAQTAIRFQLGAPGTGAIVQKALEPVVGREGGIFKRLPNGDMVLDPGWLKGEQQRLELQKSIEDQHTLTDVPLANGQIRKMTKAQALSLTGATNQIVNAIPGLDKEAIGSIQSQLAAEPDKPVNIDMNIGGRPVKMTLQPIGGGFVAGQSTEAKAAAEKSGANAGDVQQQIDTEAASALQSRKILGEMRGLATDFTPSKVAPMKRLVGEWAQALNLPGNWSEEIKSAESQQALQKLTAQMATAAMKQFTNRGTQMEFKTFLQNNPNAELTAGGFQKVLEFMDKAAAASLEKQQAYQEWRKAGNPLERSQDFLAEWNKKQNAEIGGGKQFPPPPQAAVNRLKMNPKEAAQFNEIFGPGAAEKVLGR